jgi:hypothetical protein
MRPWAECLLNSINSAALIKRGNAPKLAICCYLASRESQFELANIRGAKESTIYRSQKASSCYGGCHPPHHFKLVHGFSEAGQPQADVFQGLFWASRGTLDPGRNDHLLGVL